MTTPTHPDIAREANTIIEEAKRRGCCVKPEGDEQGKCHVFLSGSDLCVCEDRRLPKVRELK